MATRAVFDLRLPAIDGNDPAMFDERDHAVIMVAKHTPSRWLCSDTDCAIAREDLSGRVGREEARTEPLLDGGGPARARSRP
jgi:hypothetical protein